MFKVFYIVIAANNCLHCIVVNYVPKSRKYYRDDQSTNRDTIKTHTPQKWMYLRTQTYRTPILYTSSVLRCSYFRPDLMYCVHKRDICRTVTQGHQTAVSLRWFDVHGRRLGLCTYHFVARGFYTCNTDGNFYFTINKGRNSKEGW